MRILCVSAQIMRICAYYTYMRHTAEAAKRCGFLWKTAPGQNVADSSRKRPRGPGTVELYWISPLPLLSRFSLCFRATGPTYISLPTRSPHAGPRGRRTSPACGSCRRPLKKCENQGIEESNGGKKKYSASKEGTLRPSREGTKCIIFPPILERESKSRKNQWFSSPRHRRARAAHLQERIPFNCF